MDKQQLRDELKALHAQIQSALHKEPLDKDVFGHVMTDLVRVSQGESLGEGEGENLKGQIEDRAADFEARHPRIAGILRDIMDVLAKLGI